MECLLTMLRERKMSVTDLSKILDVSPPQIYKWNRDGISRNNKHYIKLKKLFPELEAKDPPYTKTGKEDGRCRSGRKKKKPLVPSDAITSNINEPTHKSALFPTIHINKTT